MKNKNHGWHLYRCSYINNCCYMYLSFSCVMVCSLQLLCVTYCIRLFPVVIRRCRCACTKFYLIQCLFFDSMNYVRACLSCTAAHNYISSIHMCYCQLHRYCKRSQSCCVVARVHVTWQWFVGVESRLREPQ